DLDGLEELNTTELQIFEHETDNTYLQQPVIPPLKVIKGEIPVNNLPPPKEQPTITADWSAGLNPEFVKQIRRDNDFQQNKNDFLKDAQAMHPVSFGGEGFGDGLARDPLIQNAAAGLLIEGIIVGPLVTLSKVVKTVAKGRGVSGAIIEDIMWEAPIADDIATYNKLADPYLDCSEIASSLNKRYSTGYILEITPKEGKLLTGIEYGSETEFSYHQVFIKGKFTYDPMFNKKPVLTSEFLKMYEKMNPGGIKLIKQ
ncbi:MAG TPA: hypothetical protein DF296_10820, partial [Candidatus Margulisbacteria bacterium]|nr:hypothetical protein [Candidatus Margulisiibacteriota bacterium]